MDHQIKTFEEYQQNYKRSVEDPEAFWADVAEGFTWRQKWDKVLDWNFEDSYLLAHLLFGFTA